MRVPRERSRGTALAAVVTAVTAAALGLSACGAGRSDGSSSNTGAAGVSGSAAASSGSGSPSSGGAPITIGTTDQVISLDPAGSYDNGSLLLEDNIYQFLMRVPVGGKAPAPDAASKCGFDSSDGHKYVCTVKPGLKFSNGDPLTAADVAFSYQRVVKIANPNGPASLLANMASVSASGDSVTFTLKNPNDQTWPFILGTSAGPIVDHKVFSPTKLLDDSKVVGSGPYKLASYQKNQAVTLQANSNYSGDETPKTSTINLSYYDDSSNMKIDVQNGDIDIAWRSLSPTDVGDLKGDSDVQVLTGAGGELRYLVFNFKTMPGDNDAQKQAIRRAVAYSVNRQQLATEVYKGTFQPAYSMVPNGIANATTPFKDVYGASPDKAKAAQVLKAAGVKTPVALNIEYTTDHYGPTSEQEWGTIKSQLEATGLFKVNLGSAAWTTYSVDRTKDTYPIYQLGWFPDYVDADNYLSPFLVEDNFVAAHYCDKGATNRPCDKDGILPLLTTEQTKSGAARTQALAAIQSKLATGELPYVPLLSGNQVAVIRKGITGVQDTLDPTYQFRMWLFGRS